MGLSTADVAGLLPAIILPLASLVQLRAVFRSQDVAGVSALSWFLFAVANVGAYVFAEKYDSWQAISGFLGTAVLNLGIVARVLIVRRRDNR